MNKKDIRSLDDVRVLVNDFYSHARQDDLLADIFNGVIRDRWPEHLEKMYRFWQTVLLGEHTYRGRPFPPHAKLPVDGRHFDRWIKLFTMTVDDNFNGPKAEEAKWRAKKMAGLFLMKIEYFNNNSANPLI